MCGAGDVLPSTRIIKAHLNVRMRWYAEDRLWRLQVDWEDEMRGLRARLFIVHKFWWGAETMHLG